MKKRKIFTLLSLLFVAMSCSGPLENTNGNDIEMPIADFMQIMKPCNADHKFGHIVAAYTA